VADRWVDEPVPCHDPECAEDGGVAEPESDGELRYYACARCGYEFGYQMARQDAGTCSLGVPEAIRRAASIEPAQEPQPVFLGTIGRRPADEVSPS
jgi:hypothetical protein